MTRLGASGPSDRMTIVSEPGRWASPGIRAIPTPAPTSSRITV